MRKTSVNILTDTLKNKNFVQKQEDAFVNMLVLTALRNLLNIEQIIKSLSKKRSDSHYIMVCAITEILYLQTPDYAIINSYVDIAKKEYGKFVGNFTNAVLRKVAKNKEEYIKNDSNKFFSQSFLKILKGYDKNTISQMEKDCKIAPQTNIVYKDGKQSFISTKVEEVEGFADGDFWVQDKAASQAVAMLDDIKGLRVLDICSAPGGKTAQLISKGANVTCVDISENRLNILQENMQRLKYTPQEIICQDAIDYLKNFNQQPFDIILLDAPCSATGTLRRHPEAVYLKDINDVKNMQKIQTEILSLCDNALVKGGIIVYCTCSLAHLEGEVVVENFLENNSYKLLQQKRIIPNIEMDGFFISKVVKL